MTEHLVARNGKLNALNKKIVEIKKKIQVSEGQRKANFEEGDARKRENAERIGRLKKEVKDLQMEFSKANNSAEIAAAAAEQAGPQLSREASAAARKRSLQDAVAALDEDNIRLRKKLDLVKYQSIKQEKQLGVLLRQYEELMSGKSRKSRGLMKPTPGSLKKQIVRLENQLHRVGVMQMEADTVRKKYRAVRASLKADASLYGSSLDGLEEGIREQDAEIVRLQGIKLEAIGLRDSTKETLTREEAEALERSKERESTIQEYRRRVEERKLELERLERAMFAASRLGPSTRDESGRGSPQPEQAAAGPSQSELERLEGTFAKLRAATGVSRTEDVLDCFLAQRATRDKLKRMRLATEDEKVRLERTRQQLAAEIEMQKFAETKEADQATEQLDRLNKQIEQEKVREEKAIAELDKVQEMLRNVGRMLLEFYQKFQEDNEPTVIEETAVSTSPIATLNKLNDKINEFIEKLGGPEKYDELLQQILSDKMEVLSLETSSEQTRQQAKVDDQPLFPLFPTATTPAALTQPSEDEEDIPTRSQMKRQAQLLVDTKSRRKGFAFKR